MLLRPSADEAPKSQGIPAKLTLNLLAPHEAIFAKKEVDQVRSALVRARFMAWLLQSRPRPPVVVQVSTLSTD